MVEQTRKTTYISSLLPLLLCLALLLSSCTPTSTQPPTPTPQADKPAARRIVVILHGEPSGGFWGVVRKGTEQAAQDLGMTVEVQGLKTFDMAEMSRMINSAVASKPDGMVISVPDVKALAPAVEAIRKAGIPFIVINAGKEDAISLGALTYIGQQEYEAGFQAGMRLAKAGVHHAYCINHEAGSAAVTQRCQGLTDALAQVNGKVDELVVDSSNDQETKDRVMMGLEIAPDVDGILTCTDLPIVLEAVKAVGKQNQVKVAGFDFSPVILSAIENGDMLFAIDQQQYLQGYLPLVFFNLYFTNANTVPQEVIATGPSFITLENVAQVKDLSTKGTR